MVTEHCSTKNVRFHLHSLYIINSPSPYQKRDLAFIYGCLKRDKNPPQASAIQALKSTLFNYSFLKLIKTAGIFGRFFGFS